MEQDHELRLPFKYWDKGTMATIGRSEAVAWIGKLKISGLIAWLSMAVRPSAFSDWFSQQTRRPVAMDLFVFHLQTQRPHHHLPAARNGK